MCNRVLVVVLVLALFATVELTAARPVAAEAGAASGIVYHVVQPGEYVISIARRYGVSPDLIFSANHLIPPYWIYPRQVFVIPRPNIYTCQRLRIPCPPPLRLTERDAGRNISLRAGQTLEVLLAGNPTTGFRWEVAEVDPAVLRQQGDPVYTPSSFLIGASGTFLFRFASAPGRTTLRLVYRRSWETGLPPTQTFQVTVVVTPERPPI